MTRKTKADREYDAMMEKVRLENAARDLYPVRMMEVLTKATEENFRMEVVNFQFVVQDRDDARSPKFVFDNYWSSASDEMLNNLEWDVDRKRDERLEAEARRNKRNAALAKLTQEERELLNLN